MRYFKSVCAGALATALLLAPGCEYKPTHPRVDQSQETGQGTGGAGMERGDQGMPRTGSSDSMNRGTTEDMARGTGGSGSSTGTGVGGTGTGDVQGDSTRGLGTGSTDSHQVGGSTGTGTQGSDMGSGGATNSAQDQGTPPR